MSQAIRDAIRDGMRAKGLTKRALSLKIGKGATYMHDFLEDGSPRDLPYEVKLQIAEVLDMTATDLGIIQPREQRSHLAGFADDAEPYLPSKQHYLSSSPHIAYFRMKSRALDQHPDRIMPGHILAFDINKISPAQIAPMSVVVVQLLDRQEGLKSHGTVMRQFVPPNKLITNSSEGNEIISIDDAALPYVAQIRGTMLAVVREMN